MDTSHQKKIWNRYFILAGLVTLSAGIGMNMISSTMAVYVYSLYGNASFTGYLNGAFAVAAVIARMIAGRICDQHTRRFVMVSGGIIFAISAFSFGAFPLAAMLIFSRALQGFGFSASSTASNAAGADVLPKERLGEGIGFLGMGYSIATAVGAIIALCFVRGNDYSMVYYMTTAILLAGVILSIFDNYEKNPEYARGANAEQVDRKPEDMRQYRGLSYFIEYRTIPAAFTQLFFCIAFAFINSFVVLYAQNKGFTNIGLFFTVSAITMTLTRFFSGKLYDKYGVLFIIIPAMLTSILTFVLLCFANSSIVFYLCGFLYGLGIGIVNSVLNVQSIKMSPANRWGAASGTYLMANDIGYGVGAILWGYFIDTFGYTVTFFGCIVVILISMFLSLKFFRKQ